MRVCLRMDTEAIKKIVSLNLFLIYFFRRIFRGYLLHEVCISEHKQELYVGA